MAEPMPVPEGPARLKAPPHSIEAEQSFLGGLMLDENAWLKVADTITVDDFHRPSHRIIFGAMSELANANQPLDNVTLREALSSRSLLDKAGGANYLVDLVESTPGASNVAAYAEIIKERATLRRLINAANEIADTAFEPEGRSSADVLDHAEQLVFEIGEGRISESMPQRVGDVTEAVAHRLDFLSKSGSTITGVATGFDDLDRRTAGFQKSDLVIVAARPSMGKTALIVNMAEHAVMTDQGKDHQGAVLIFSLEQPADQLVMRMLSSLGRIDQTHMRTGHLSAEDWDRFDGARMQLKDKVLYIDDTPALTPNAIRARARRVSRDAGGLKMIMVDYLQLMRPSNAQENRTNEIAEISRSLKAIAKEMQCPVVACSQLNRALENRSDKRPYMSDLRESGAIEQDADVILFIYRDEVYNPESEDKGLAEIIIGKQRNGPIGMVKLTFMPELTKFDNHIDTDAYGLSPPPDFAGDPGVDFGQP